MNPNINLPKITGGNLLVVNKLPSRCHEFRFNIRTLYAGEIKSLQNMATTYCDLAMET